MIKPWQNGYELDLLKSIAALFKAHDAGLLLGAFSAIKENAVADLLKRQQLKLVDENGFPIILGRADAGKLVAAIVVGAVSARTEVKDFAGETIATLRPGNVRIRRVACLPGYEQQLMAAVRQRVDDAKRGRYAGGGFVYFDAWQEHKTDRAIADELEFGWLGTRITAASEYFGLYRTPQRPHDVKPEQFATLVRLDVKLPVTALRGLAAAATDMPMADHYSSYNKRHSWSALALRGYSSDPTFIVKPSEMSVKYRDENSQQLGWQLTDTPLRKVLAKWAEPLIAAIPGVKHRIRLMRLAPGGGELTRHADITDPDAGVRDGQLMRIHLPLFTNPEVRFEMWDLAGARRGAHMAAGEAWYLDTRKAHRAGNFGTTDRVHLVLDVESSPALRALLGPEAPLLAAASPAA